MKLITWEDLELGDIVIIYATMYLLIKKEQRNSRNPWAHYTWLHNGTLSVTSGLLRDMIDAQYTVIRDGECLKHGV